MLGEARVMSVQNSDIEIAQLKEEIQQKIHHPYLMKFIKAPSIDEDKLVLLYSFMRQARVNKKEMSNIIVAVMLVQIALDTHDSVSVDKVEEDSLEMKSRQLTVLAGDYYSGLYYYLLAQFNDIPIIQILAEAIKVINEQKIKVYRNKMTVEEFLNSVQIVESFLLQKTARFYHIPSMEEIVSDFCLMKRMMSERNQFLQTGTSILFEVIKKDLSESVHYSKQSKKGRFDQAIFVCDQYLTEIIVDLKRKIENINGDYQKIVLGQFNQLCSKLSFIAEKVVEEGY